MSYKLVLLGFSFIVSWGLLITAGVLASKVEGGWWIFLTLFGGCFVDNISKRIGR